MIPSGSSVCLFLFLVTEGAVLLAEQPSCFQRWRLWKVLHSRIKQKRLPDQSIIPCVRAASQRSFCTSAATSPPRLRPLSSGDVPSDCNRPIGPWGWSLWWSDPPGGSLYFVWRVAAGTDLRSPARHSPAHARRRSPSGGYCCVGSGSGEVEEEESLWPAWLWTSPEGLWRQDHQQSQS